MFWISYIYLPSPVVEKESFFHVWVFKLEEKRKCGAPGKKRENERITDDEV